MSFTISTASYFLLVEVAFSLIETITDYLPFSLPSLAAAKEYETWFLGATILVLGVGFLFDRAAKTKPWGLPPLLLIYTITSSIILAFQQYNDSCHNIVLILGATGFVVLLPSTFGPWIKRLKSPTPPTDRD
jgi:FtsH-binding integral membrane protein